MVLIIPNPIEISPILPHHYLQLITQKSHNFNIILLDGPGLAVDGCPADIKELTLPGQTQTGILRGNYGFAFIPAQMPDLLDKKSLSTLS